MSFLGRLEALLEEKRHLTYPDPLTAEQTKRLGQLNVALASWLYNEKPDSTYLHFLMLVGKAATRNPANRNVWEPQ